METKGDISNTPNFARIVGARPFYEYTNFASGMDTPPYTYNLHAFVVKGYFEKHSLFHISLNVTKSNPIHTLQVCTKQLTVGLWSIFPLLILIIVFIVFQLHMFLYINVSVN